MTAQLTKQTPRDSAAHEDEEKTAQALPLRNYRLMIILLGLVGGLALIAVASVTLGAREVSFTDVLAALSGHTDTIAQAAVSQRVPRTILAMTVGAALAVSGATMQAVTRNPLADPGIFGVLAGASLAVVIGITFFQLTGQAATFFIAILGSAAAAIFVYTVGSLGHGGATPLKLALAGAATSAAIGSVVSAILLPRADVMDTFRFWQIGSVGGASFSHLSLALPFLTVGAVLCWLSATGLNSLALGDDVATGLGSRVLTTRLVSSLGAVILCGVATALAGPIGFVGLIVPHLCRLLIGTDHRWLLPASAISGAILLVTADTIGRVIAAPNEIAVAILTPVIGAPLFIWIVRRRKMREL